MNMAYLPSPAQGVWHLGPVPIRAYALCILAGIFTAVWLTGRRWEARGGRREDIADIAIWAVPFGVLGGRLYHVITDPELYFAAGKQPLHALYIWDGGLGIPGAVALGAVGAWLGCRRRGIKLADFADAVAPGLVLAQAIGRWGNYFNQELYGSPTDLPWALRIDPANRPADSLDVVLYHPTFLYESLWNLGVMALLLWLDRRRHPRLRRGRLFACYVLAYTAGRFWIEALRIDHANQFLGLRLNSYVSLVLLVGALVYLIATRRPRPDDDAPYGEARAADEVPVPVQASGAKGVVTVPDAEEPQATTERP
ncbi:MULTISPECIES: prolipoprotein diacylglyceryl transferase [Streptomyces]|uniref:prolipoprotein diacylglyceryl transferase n=1 Tax=Streptomyces TaxID=1883 RepID=UPI000A3A8227|nr:MULTISPECIES: prolipoprotein diacylglyceryl transferase [Streptomyces]MDX3611693.1 prolipoprotein diacylglyceryl transferase [Streptomyces europaeiscabiei]MDX3632093.1 prolipoprotein diacylglyceryl transferase [Streptomyces europaeiscabiei]MDX3649813.1 prolipoprotein diacylglyceryl transferase [Streptomyces europaeiscabiei]